MRLHVRLPGPFSVSTQVGRTRGERRAAKARRRRNRARRAVRTSRRRRALHREIVGLATGSYVTLFVALFGVAGGLFLVSWLLGLVVVCMICYLLGTTWRGRAALPQPAPPVAWNQLPTILNNPAAHHTHRDPR